MHYTAAQASAVTGLSIAAIHKAIERGLIEPVAIPGANRPARLLSREHLVFLHLEANGLAVLPISERKAIAEAIAADPLRGDLLVPSAQLLLVKHRAARRQTIAALRQLEKVRRMANSDPEIMRGEPVYRGTRIPIALIAQMLNQGAAVAELAEGYPALTAEQIELAPLYVRAFPRRGRPPLRAWASRSPVRTTRKAATVGASPA